VAVARANLAALGRGGAVQVADATTLDLSGFGIVFADPARRTPRGRVFDVAAYQPPWSFVERVLAGPACVKVAPGIPHEIVPPGVEAEWVSDGGEVKEAALWFGDLAGPPRRATLLPTGSTLCDAGHPAPAVAAVRRWLYDPDGAVVRAHLVGELAARIGGTLIDSTIAYLTTEHHVSTPFARAYEVLDVLPFGVKRLRAALRARRVGRVTVKKRGSAVEPDELRLRLRLAGPEEAVVVLTRVAGKPTALICAPPHLDVPREKHI
jgi:hypothetical protein